MWMRDRRDGPGIHADASGTEGPDAGSLRVSSGRRCEHHNDRVSTAKNEKNGVHTLGKASDILTYGERAMLLFEKARQIGFSGIGLSQRGPHQDRFVHLDTKPRKALWSY